MIDKLSPKKGFTLLELTIAIVIVGILAAIAVPAHDIVVQKAKQKETKAMLLLIKNAEGMYKDGVGNGSYGSGVNIAGINSILNLDILAPSDIQYACTGGASFTCTATHPKWAMSITDSSGPTCITGTCYP
jgi:prepilin-type N-terminal cleavage/methylation domain-containing protein